MTTKRTITLITAIVLLLIFCLVAPVKAFAENGEAKEQGVYQKESKQETILLEDVSQSMTKAFCYEVRQMQIQREQFTLYRPFDASTKTNLYGDLEPEETETDRQELEKEIIEETVVEKITSEEESSEIVNIPQYEFPTFWDMLSDMFGVFFKVIGTIIWGIGTAILIIGIGWLLVVAITVGVAIMCVIVEYIIIAVLFIGMYIVTIMGAILELFFKFVAYIVGKLLYWLERYPILKFVFTIPLIALLIYWLYTNPLRTLLIMFLCMLILVIVAIVLTIYEKIDEKEKRIIDVRNQLSDWCEVIMLVLLSPLRLTYRLVANLINWIVKKIRI